MWCEPVVAAFSGAAARVHAHLGVLTAPQTARLPGVPRNRNRALRTEGRFVNHPDVPAKPWGELGFDLISVPDVALVTTSRTGFEGRRTVIEERAATAAPEPGDGAEDHWTASACRPKASSPLGQATLRAPRLRDRRWSHSDVAEQVGDEGGDGRALRPGQGHMGEERMPLQLLHDGHDAVVPADPQIVTLRDVVGQHHP
jgi:hypothetical protein